MTITSTQRVLAIGLAVFVMSAVAAPSIATAEKPLNEVFFRSAIPSPTFDSSFSGLRGLKKSKRSHYRVKSILRYSTSFELGNTDVTMRLRARLKPRSIFKFDIIF
jgi:hypothetical protein